MSERLSPWEDVNRNLAADTFCLPLLLGAQLLTHRPNRPPAENPPSKVPIQVSKECYRDFREVAHKSCHSSCCLFLCSERCLNNHSVCNSLNTYKKSCETSNLQVKGTYQVGYRLHNFNNYCLQLEVLRLRETPQQEGQSFS